MSRRRAADAAMRPPHQPNQHHRVLRGGCVRLCELSVDSPGMEALFPRIMPESLFYVPAGVRFLKVTHDHKGRPATAFSFPPSTLQRLHVDKGCFPNVRETTIAEQAELRELVVREGAFRRVETMDELKEARRLVLRDCAKLERVNVENGCFAHYTSFEATSGCWWEG